ncbi:hypothetical protein [Nocardia asteroides]|uniref:hypothetical protein n=1 Tax=Nocardia asteroides TaxID=1824 RepID=UPI001E2EF9E1|nr:hypothetical protein [Nocardia asteroides]UGT53988.1 hypothetical protein LTT85_25500 [Nocardia asteroides]
MHTTPTPAILASALHKVFADSTQAPDALVLWLDIAACAVRELSLPILPVMVPWVPVVLRYRLHRTEGEFFPYTGSVRVLTGPLTGTTFSDPDSAAHAVVGVTPAPVYEQKVLPSWRFRSTGTPAAFTPPAIPPLIS